MSNHNYPRRLLDDAIDRAVHELMQAEPRPGFRRRVLGKLNEPAAGRSWITTLLIPVGAVAAVVMAIWLRPAAPASPGAAPAPQIVAQRPVAPPPVTAEKPVTQTHTTAATEREAVRRPRGRQTSVPFTFGPQSGRVAATSVPNPAGSAPHDIPAASDPPIRQIAPLVQPSEIPLLPIELKDIILRIPPRIY